MGRQPREDLWQEPVPTCDRDANRKHEHLDPERQVERRRPPGPSAPWPPPAGSLPLADHLVRRASRRCGQQATFAQQLSYRRQCRQLLLAPGTVAHMHGHPLLGGCPAFACAIG